jgi:hypothetical protein
MSKDTTMQILSTSAPLAHPPRTSADPVFASIIVAHREAENDYYAYHRETYEPAETAITAEIAAIPHYTTKTSFSTLEGDRRIHMTTADPMHCRIVRDHTDSPLKGLSDWYECIAELSAELAIRKAKIAAIHSRYKLAELEAEMERLSDITGEAMDAIEHYPVTTLADLLCKIELMRKDDLRDVDADRLLDDLRRIADREAPSC